MTKDEYERLVTANTKIEGYGLDVTMHLPCPFCAAPDFMLYKVIDANDALRAGAVCKSCGRGMKGIVQESSAETTIEMVQTCGNDPPEFLPPMRRVNQ